MITDFQKIFSELKNEDVQLNSKVLIVDALNSYIRCFAAVPSMNDDGAHVGGMSGFLKSIGLAIRTLRPTRCILVFDGKGGSQRRRKLFPEYKDNRKTMARLNRTYDFKDKDDEVDAMRQQLLVLIDLLQHLPVTTLAIDNVEADDVIAYITHIMEERSSHTYIMSTDKDFLQLVNERVEIWNPIKKKLYTESEILAEYQIHPKNFIMYRILDGDKSDNIPGVKGIGLKKLIKHYPQLASSTKLELADVFDYALQNKGKLYESITNSHDVLERNFDLMRLDNIQIADTTKMRVVHQIDDNVPKMDKFSLTKLFHRYKLWSSFSNYDEWLMSTFLPLTRFALTEK